jgi:hypothetical protein
MDRQTNKKIFEQPIISNGHGAARVQGQIHQDLSHVEVRAW